MRKSVATASPRCSFLSCFVKISFSVLLTGILICGRVYYMTIFCFFCVKSLIFSSRNHSLIHWIFSLHSRSAKANPIEFSPSSIYLIKSINFVQHVNSMRWNFKRKQNARANNNKNLLELLWEMIDNFMMWFNATASIFYRYQIFSDSFN